jgi:uncharacterized membrane protein YdjX (TVP38/TMEM64 family)
LRHAPSSPESSSKLPWFISGGFLLLLLAAYFFIPDFQAIAKEAWAILTSGDRAKISEWVRQFGIWGPLFIIIFMVLQMFLVVINVVALMVVAVLAYGPVWGGVISLIGIFVASSLGYWVGRGLGPATIDKILGAKTEKKITEQVERYGSWAVVLARISPLISNDAISFVAGLVRMPYLRFMLATAAGIIPLIILIGYLGNDMDRLKTGLLVLSGVGIALLIGYYLYDRLHRSREKIN